MEMNESKNHGQSQNANNSISSSNKSETRIFSKLTKDPDNLKFYFQKSLNRFKACCLSLGYLFEPLGDRVVIKVRSLEIIDFLKRIFLFDFKKLVILY